MINKRIVAKRMNSFKTAFDLSGAKVDLFPAIEDENMRYDFFTHKLNSITFLFKDDEIQAVVVNDEDEEVMRLNNNLIDSSKEMNGLDLDYAIGALIERLQPSAIDLYKLENCPICDTKMDVEIKEETEEYYGMRKNSCSNGCFSIDCSTDGRALDHSTIKTFEDIIYINNFDNKKLDLNKAYENRVKHEIRYWRENERYLLRLMDIENIGREI